MDLHDKVALICVGVILGSLALRFLLVFGIVVLLDLYEYFFGYKPFKSKPKNRLGQ